MVAKARRRPPFWRQQDPPPPYDISLLRPATLPKGKRFETLDDAKEESERNQGRVRDSIIEGELEACRERAYHCDQPYCPICARTFRRWLTGELLHITEHFSNVQIMTVLLQEVSRDRIVDLDLPSWRDALRNRLKRSGLAQAVVIGGFEVAYKAKKKTWVLHANLVVIGGNTDAHRAFIDNFRSSGLERRVLSVALADPATQLSYVLKFATYHRPYE